MTAEWLPQWHGEIVAIIASGESAKSGDVDLLRGRCRCVVINNSFEIAPWADLLYAADGKWWLEYREAGSFQGIKVTASTAADVAKVLGLNVIDFVDAPGHEEESVMSFVRPGMIARGGNSGFQAVNLTAQTGAKRQVWIGFDFCGDHWHGEHRGNLRNPRSSALSRWARTLDAQAAILKAAGIEVLNCSAKSVLKAYPKVTLADAINRWQL